MQPCDDPGNEWPAAHAGSRFGKLVAREGWFALLAILGFVLVFLGGKLLPTGGGFIAGQDTLDLSLWGLLFLKKQLGAGMLPLWNPHAYCGQPFLANMVNFALYPPVALFLLLPMPWAFNVDLVLHLTLAGTGVYALTRTMARSRTSGLVAALVYTLGSSMLSRVGVGHIGVVHAAAWLPWIFTFVERAFARTPGRNLVFAGMAFTMELLCGYPQGCVYTGIFLGLYAVLRSVLQREPLPLGRRMHRLAAWLLVPATTLGLGAIAWLPARELLLRSNRAVGSYAFATRLSLPPENLLTLLLGGFEHSSLTREADFGCYLGIIALALVLVAVIGSANRPRILTWLVMILVALSFALGGYTPVYHAYTRFIPFVREMRVPARAIFMLVLFLSVMAGLGAECLLNGLSRRSHRLLLGLFVALVLAGLGVARPWLTEPLASTALIRTYLFIALSLALLIAWPWLRSPPLRCALLLTLLFVDLRASSVPIPIAHLDEIMAKTEYEQFIEQDRSDFRVLIPIGFSQANMSLASRCNYFGCYNAGGYVPGGLNDLYVFLHAMADLPVPSWAQHTPDLALFRAESAFSSRILGIKYALVFTPRGRRLLGTSRIMPRASLLHRAAIVPRYADHLPILKDPRFDPRQTVLLESDPDDHARTLPEDGGTQAGHDSVVISLFQANAMEIETASDSSSFLVLSEMFYPGWNAWVDGQRASVLRADYLLRAVPLAAGRHHVRLEFFPESLKWGAAMSGTTLGLLALLWLRARRRSGARDHAGDGSSAAPSTLR